MTESLTHVAIKNLTNNEKLSCAGRDNICKNQDVY